MADGIRHQIVDGASKQDGIGIEFVILLPGPLLGITAMLLLRQMPEVVKIAGENPRSEKRNYFGPGRCS
jgi:hypothetical protein